jgi:hypothetical protein
MDYIIHCSIPVVPHKEVAEFQKQETYSRGWLL